MKDSRFTISREWTGKARPQHVVRFCGDWVESYSSLVKAKQGRIEAINKRNLSLTENALCISSFDRCLTMLNNPINHN